MIKKTHMLEHALDSLGYAEGFLVEAGPVSNPLLADALAAISKTKASVESAMTARSVPGQKLAYKQKEAMFSKMESAFAV